MSQERTRFPIQPKDVRRSAKSSKDVALKGGRGTKGDRAQSDKPSVPPHRRKHADTPDSQGIDTQATGPTEDSGES